MTHVSANTGLIPQMNPFQPQRLSTRCAIESNDRNTRSDFSARCHNVQVVRNVSAGNKGAGFVHWSNGKYDPAADNYTRMPADRIPANAAYNPRRFADGSAVINDLPFLEFSDNQAYGNFIGLKTRFTTGHGDVPMNETIADVTHGLQTQSGSPPVLAPSVVSNLTVWANWIGVVASYTTMSYQHVLVVAPRTEVASYVVSANGFQPAVGLSVRGPRELAFDDFRVVNYKRGTYFQQNRDKPREKFLPQGIVTFGVLRDFTTSLDPKIIIP